MISFATLFLGLVFGAQQVDFVVADSVAVVDVLLDGEVIETLEGPPWLEEGLAEDLALSQVDGTGRLVLGSWGGSAEIRSYTRAGGALRVPN